MESRVGRVRSLVGRLWGGDLESRLSELSRHGGRGWGGGRLPARLSYLPQCVDGHLLDDQATFPVGPRANFSDRDELELGVAPQLFAQFNVNGSFVVRREAGSRNIVQRHLTGVALMELNLFDVIVYAAMRVERGG